MKTKFFSLIFFLSFSFTAFSQYNYDEWELQNPYPTANMLSDISFVNDSVGWIVGERGTILKTTDGGQTWDIQESGTDLWLMNVSFTDENTGFASGNNSMVVYTVDGGENWLRMPGFQWYSDPLKSIYVVNPDTVWFGSWNGQIYGCFNYGSSWKRIAPGGSYMEINSIWFPGNKRGIAAGGSLSGGRFYKVSDDGGETWQSQTINDSIGDITDMVFTSPDTGYLLSEKYMVPVYVYKTVDAGATWHPVYHIIGNNWKKLFFLDNNTGYALTYGAIYKTTDGGLSWELRSYLYGSTYYTDLFFSSESTGYICTYSGEIFKTVDGGENWEPLSRGYHETLYSVAFTDDKTGWAISQNMLLHTTDGGVHWNNTNNISIFGGRKLFFTDKNHGWLLDDYGNKLYKTVNGGDEWTLLGSIDGTGSKLYFSDTLHGWFINAQGELSGTSDAGLTWTKTVLPSNLEVKDVVGENEKVWIICENQDELRAELYYSDDYGVTWLEQYHDFDMKNAVRLRRSVDGKMFLLGEGSKIFKSENDGRDWNLINNENFGLINMSVVNSSEIYAINSASDLVYSNDGGNTWNVSETPFRNFKDLCFLDNQGWAVGESGVIAHVNTLTLSVDEKTPVNNKIIDIYPNPGTSVINIKSDYNDGYFQLFSMYGEKVFSDKIKKGYNKLRIDDLPAGIYPYRIIDKYNKTVASGKWVKM